MMVDFIFMQSGIANQHQLDCLSLSYVGSINTILKVGYTPPAPAVYMFTPNIIKKYNRIFNFLLKIRLVQKAIDLNLRKINNKEARKYIGHICHIVEVLQSFLYSAVILPMSTRNWLHFCHQHFGANQSTSNVKTFLKWTKMYGTGQSISSTGRVPIEILPDKRHNT